MKVSVVIPVKNRRRYIGELLQSLMNQRIKPYEIIVVDGGSTDGTLEVARNFPVKILFDEGRGTNAARNIGLLNAKGDIVAFIDADCVAPPDWLENMVKELENGDHICVGGSAIIHPKLRGNIIAEYANTGFFPVMPVYRERKVITKENVVSQRLPNTNNLGVVRRILIEEKLYFDEGIKGGAEEQEFLWRILEKGYSILVSDKIKVYHYHRRTLKGLLKQVYRYGRGLYRFYHKHRNAPLARIPALIIIIFYTSLASSILLSILVNPLTLGVVFFIVFILPFILLTLFHLVHRKTSFRRALVYSILDIIVEICYSIGFMREFLGEVVSG
ncbi:MAG: glycosyltransferase [Thermoproteales archaeon]|nr:glycosyltransferase [Thermoproteales archaeon]